MFLYGEPQAAWLVEPFFVYDEARFFQWLSYWPEVESVINSNGSISLYPSDAIMETMYHNGEYWIDIPCYLCDPEDQSTDEYGYPMTDLWTLPEEAGTVPNEMIFIHELANHIDDHTTCVLKHFMADYGGQTKAIAYGIVGGEGSPESRICVLDMDEIYGRALDLDGGQIALAYEAA